MRFTAILLVSLIAATALTWLASGEVSASAIAGFTFLVSLSAAFAAVCSLFLIVSRRWAPPLVEAALPVSFAPLALGILLCVPAVSAAATFDKLSDHRSMLRGGDSGKPIIVPGIPEASRLVRVVSGQDPELTMPPREENDALSGAEIGLMERWIREGAKWPAMIDASSDKQLFIDDQIIAKSENVTLRVNPPRKTGEVLVRSDRLWESFLTCNYPTVIAENGQFRMWYEAYQADYAAGDFGARLCYAESKDGREWTKPELGLVEFMGSKANNIVYPNEPIPYHGGSVFYDPAAALTERYKLVSMGPGGINGAVSADGIHWLHIGTILRGMESDTQNVCFLDSDLRRYVLYCRMWTGGQPGKGFRAIGRRESLEFRSFPPARIVLEPQAPDPPEHDLYTNAAVKYPYAASAYFLFPSVFDHPADALDIQPATSRDGIQWTRHRQPAWIARGGPGSFDSMCLYQAPGCIRHGDKLFFYYSAYSVGHDKTHPKNVQKAGTLSRAVLRLDGFVSADAPDSGGTLTTIPLTFVGNQLQVNATGRFRVALLDRPGKPIPGFNLDDCDPFDGDSVRHTVTWKGKSAGSSLAGQLVQLQFELKAAKLYAFQFSAQVQQP